MKIRSVRIVSMPGFPRGGPVLEDLCGGMNVILGSNGAGKTTFARAIRWLLWPATAEKNALRVISAQTFDDHPLEVNQSQPSGQSALKLPPDSHADCFTITADDLFDQGTATFAERVKKAITGQVSVNSLYQREDGSRSLEAELENLQRRYESRLREMDEKRGRIAQLPELKEKLAEALKAERRLVNLKRALEKRQLERALASMKGMESARPTDLGDALRLSEEIGSRKERSAELARMIQQCRRKLSGIGLSQVPESLGEIRNTLETLKALTRRRAELEERHAGLARLLEGLPKDVSLLNLDALLSAGLKNERLAGRLRDARTRLGEVQERLDGIAEEHLSDGRSILARWLALKEHRDYVLPAGMILLLVLLLLPGGDHLTAGVAVMILAGSLLLPFMKARSLQQSYSGLRLPKPRSWTVHDVLGVIGSLEDVREAVKLRDGLTDQLLQFEQEEGPLQEEFRKLRDRLGVSSALGLELVTDRMKRIPELDELRGLLENARLRADECLVKLGSLLADCGFRTPDSLESAVSQVGSLEEKVNVLLKETGELEELQGSESANSAELARAESEFNGIFQRNGLQEGDLAALKQRDDGLQDYRDIVLQLRRLSVPEGEATFSEEELEAEIRGAAELASSLEEIRGSVTLAMAAEEEMEHSVELVELLSDIQRMERRKEIKDLRNRRVRIRNRLLDSVKKKYQVEIQPPVVNSASALLTRFTAGRYGLNPIGLEDIEFEAHDMQTDMPVPLDQLSRGTRMQLLLALKIAFAELVESDEKLPLVLDEVLATTDLRRFREVVGSLADLVREGRQLFYLTCQEPDASLIREVFRFHAGGDVNLVRLDRGEPGEWPEFRSLEAAVPEPGDMGYDAYVRMLRPIRVAPGTVSGELHPAWILNDTGTLYRLLSAGLDSVGKALAAGERVLSPGEVRHLLSASEVAEEVLSAFARGRARSLDRHVLENSPLASSRMLEETWRLCERVGNDPYKLIAALKAKEVPNFRASLISRLEGYLSDSGFFPEDTVLTRDEAWIRVLNAVPGDPQLSMLIFNRLWNELGASTK